MDLINLTPIPITGRFDGKVYTVEPGDWLGVADDTGNHLLTKLERKGLRRVHVFDLDTEEKREKLSLDANLTLLRWMKHQVAEHEGNNRAQEERKFPPLSKPRGVAEAERYIPILEEHVSTLAQKVGEDEMADMEAAARKALEKINAPPQVPGLNELPLPQLRELAKEMNIVFTYNANAVTLRKMIRDAQAAEQADEEESANVGSVRS